MVEAISDLETFHAAKQLVKRYGHDAEFHAAERTDAMLEAGDLEWQRVWRRTLKAVDELLNKKPPLGTRRFSRSTQGRGCAS